MDYNLMTIDELETEQERIHERFEQAKIECFDKWAEVQRLSEEFMKIEEVLNKLNGKA